MIIAHPSWHLITPTAELILIPCPGTKELDVAQSLSQLKTEGAHGLISLMPTTEMQHHQVANIQQECQKLGLSWFHLPIEDDCAPEHAFHEAWQQDRATILHMLKQGQCLAIHCKGGTGRTGLMACLLLLELGAALEPSIEAIKALRPKALNLAVHQDYIRAINDTLNKE